MQTCDKSQIAGGSPCIYQALSAWIVAGDEAHNCCFIEAGFLVTRLEVEIQLVTAKQGGFAEVGVKAGLYQLDESQPNGISKVVHDADVEIRDPDHWISLDATTKRSHADAGVGGLAVVCSMIFRSLQIAVFQILSMLQTFMPRVM